MKSKYIALFKIMINIFKYIHLNCSYSRLLYYTHNAANIINVAQSDSNFVKCKLINLLKHWHNVWNKCPLEFLSQVAFQDQGLLSKLGCLHLLYASLTFLRIYICFSRKKNPLKRPENRCSKIHIPGLEHLLKENSFFTFTTFFPS